MSPRTQAQNKIIQEQTRQQIIMSALKLFSEKGYASTSVSAIAKAAGISKGLIYHYFSSKEEVLKGIFNMMLEEGDRIMEGWDGKTAAEKLRYSINESVQFIKQQTQIMRFMLSLALQPDVINDLEEMMEQEKQRSMEKYKEIFWELGYEDPELEAYYTGALLDGVTFGFAAVKDYPLDKLEQKLLNHYKL